MPSMALGAVEEPDVVIIGNGPSALILSYILHGHIPYYSGGHQDQLLDQRLSKAPDLRDVIPDLYNHLRTSLNYSTQALPVNVLFDALLRPHGDASTTSDTTCVVWRFEPEKAVRHLVLGNAPRAGGQWVENPVAASWEIEALSYAEQLTLPGYSFSDYWKKTRGEELKDYVRPSRHDVADYFAAYPEAVGIQDTLHNSTEVLSVKRVADGFYLAPQNIACKQLVLASGTFTFSQPPPHFLQPLTSLDTQNGTVLVVGSGFTAADIIISTPPNRKIVHLFNWDPKTRPSPLKACHASAYPEYAWVYKQMKLAVDRFETRQSGHRHDSLKEPRKTPVSSLATFKNRDWLTTYEGFPNARIMSAEQHHETGTETLHPQHHHFGRRSSHAPPTDSATVEIGRSSIGGTVYRTIGSFRNATGRRGSLGYLATPLLHDILPPSSQSATPLHISLNLRDQSSHAPTPTRTSLDLGHRIDATQDASAEHNLLQNGHGKPRLLETDTTEWLRRGSAERDFALDEQSSRKALISGHTLRVRIEEAADMEEGKATAAGLELAPNVFVIGSLTGDSLVRFAYGGCAVVAGRLMNPSATPLVIQNGQEDKLPEVGTQIHNDAHPVGVEAAPTWMEGDQRLTSTKLNAPETATPQESVTQHDRSANSEVKPSSKANVLEHLPPAQRVAIRSVRNSDTVSKDLRPRKSRCIVC